jgi:hypothetical protein
MTGKAAGSPAYWRYAGDRERSQCVLGGSPRKRGAPRSVSAGCAPAGPGPRKETLDTRHRGPGLIDILVVEPGEPGCQAVDGRLELGIQVNELAQSLGEPGQAHLFNASPSLEFFDPTVGEVHGTLAPERLLDEGGLLAFVAGV